MNLITKKNELAQETMEASNEDLHIDVDQTDSNQDLNRDANLEAEAQVDFTPLHQCIHIHEVLGKRNLLKLIYDENRRLQIEILLKKTFNFQGTDLKPFKDYMERISGFFIVEAIVMESTTEFRSRYHVSST